MLHSATVGNAGYVKLLDMMGDDNSPVRAARISYDNMNTEGEQKDRERLSRYLIKNRHSSPFEQVELQWEVQAPIFVFRQWHRHRTASLNEMSARYTKMNEVYYVPTEWRGQDTKNKQGSSGLAVGSQEILTKKYTDHIEHAFDLYYWMIDQGVSKEMARFHLPVSTYSKMVWKANLHNTWHFLKLRRDAHAQPEIRDFAVAMFNIMKLELPLLMNIWEQEVLNK